MPTHHSLSLLRRNRALLGSLFFLVLIGSFLLYVRDRIQQEVTRATPLVYGLNLGWKTYEYAYPGNLQNNTTPSISIDYPPTFQIKASSASWYDFNVFSSSDNTGFPYFTVEVHPNDVIGHPPTSPQEYQKTLQSYLSGMGGSLGSFHSGYTTKKLGTHIVYYFNQENPPDSQTIVGHIFDPNFDLKIAYVKDRPGVRAGQGFTEQNAERMISTLQIHTNPNRPYLFDPLTIQPGSKVMDMTVHSIAPVNSALPLSSTNAQISFTGSGTIKAQVHYSALLDQVCAEGLDDQPQEPLPQIKGQEAQIICLSDPQAQADFGPDDSFWHATLTLDQYSLTSSGGEATSTATLTGIIHKERY